MRRINKYLCLITLCFPIIVLAQDKKGIQWVTNLTWENVKAKAKSEGKFIFVDAYTTWCGPCKKMDREVYIADKVGETLNPRFLSVRVQMDQTKNDNVDVKNWYQVAKQLNDQYSIEGYPSFLFFNSEGKLVHKALGFRDISGFIELTKDALTDPETRYIKLTDKFKSGQLDFVSMPDLARLARNKKDKQLTLEIAKHFKEEYLDKLNDDDAFKKENLSFMVDFAWDLMKTSDRYFKFIYQNTVVADSILNRKISSLVIYNIIRKEEIVDKVYKYGKAITTQKPDWAKYRTSIENKYGKRYADELFPEEQISFYQNAKDWKNYTKYVNKKIKKYPPQAEGRKLGPYGDAWTLNHYSWTLFLFCNNPNELKKAIPWVDMAIRLDTTAYNSGYYDTKANLLYRIHRVKEAIKLEEIAVARAEPRMRQELIDNLGKMKTGKPTWFVMDEKGE